MKQECHHTARCQQRQTGAVSRKHESKDESGISEAAYAENERLEQERPPLCTPGTACCKALPVQQRRSRLPLPMPLLEGGMESSHCLMASRQSFLSSRENLDILR